MKVNFSIFSVSDFINSKVNKGHFNRMLKKITYDEISGSITCKVDLQSGKRALKTCLSFCSSAASLILSKMSCMFSCVLKYHINLIVRETYPAELIGEWCLPVFTISENLIFSYLCTKSWRNVLY